MLEERWPTFMFYELDLFMYDVWLQIVLLRSIMISDSWVHLLNIQTQVTACDLDEAVSCEAVAL